MSALNHKTILVTGSAGFIGANLVQLPFKEMNEGTIIGLDNLSLLKVKHVVFDVKCILDRKLVDGRS